MCALVVAHVVKNVELQFRPPVTDVGNPGSFEIALGFLRNIARVTAIRFARYRIKYIADQIQSGDLKDWIRIGGFGIRDKQHIAFMNFLETPDA